MLRNQITLTIIEIETANARHLWDSICKKFINNLHTNYISKVWHTLIICVYWLMTRFLYFFLELTPMVYVTRDGNVIIWNFLPTDSIDIAILAPANLTIIGVLAFLYLSFITCHNSKQKNKYIHTHTSIGKAYITSIGSPNLAC